MKNYITADFVNNWCQAHRFPKANNAEEIAQGLNVVFNAQLESKRIDAHVDFVNSMNGAAVLDHFAFKWMDADPEYAAVARPVMDFAFVRVDGEIELPEKLNSMKIGDTVNWDLDEDDEDLILGKLETFDNARKFYEESTAMNPTFHHSMEYYRVTLDDYCIHYTITRIAPDEIAV